MKVLILNEMRGVIENGSWHKIKCWLPLLIFIKMRMDFREIIDKMPHFAAKFIFVKIGLYFVEDLCYLIV